MRAALLLAFLLPAGCDAGSPPPPGTPAPAPPAVEELKESRHLADLGSRDYPAAAAPAEPPTIRLDFSGRRIYAYDFHQRVANRSRMGGASDREIGQSMSADGALLLKSKGDGRGTLLLKGAKSRMSVDPGGLGKPSSMEMPLPVMAVPDVREDGGMEGGALAAQPFLRLLLPLPPKPLAVGETAEVPLSFPFNLAGSPLTVKGAGKITLSGYVAIEERTCARLDVEIDISKLDVPEELESRAECWVKGRGVHYWDVEKKDFAAGETALLMKMSGEIAAPEKRSLRMFSDNLLRITRNEELAAREAAGK